MSKLKGGVNNFFFKFTQVVRGEARFEHRTMAAKSVLLATVV